MERIQRGFRVHELSTALGNDKLQSENDRLERVIAELQGTRWLPGNLELHEVATQSDPSAPTAGRKVARREVGP